MTRRPPAPSRKRRTTAERREVYEEARGEAEFPTCNLCPFLVLPGQKWVVSHVPVMHALGGTKTGVAHARCNAQYWATVEAPMLAKVKHMYDRHRGIHVARNPLPGGRDDPLHRKRTMDGRVVDRRTGDLWRRRK